MQSALRGVRPLEQPEHDEQFEARFKGALSRLDLPPDTDQRDENGFVRRRTLVEWAEHEGLVLSPPDTSMELEEPAAHRHRSSERLNPAAFIALMVAGAGGAAILFYQPLIRIFAH